MRRRQFMQTMGSGALLAATSGCAVRSSSARAKVVVIGGGYGGATAAKYIKMRSDGAIDVTLVEPGANFISCPLSNLVLGGSRHLSDLTLTYDNLARRHGVRIVRDAAQAIDIDRRIVRLAGGATLAYDRLVLSPGIGFMWDQVPGMNAPGARERVLHAWKAGAQTLALRKQLEAMADGGTFAIAIPAAPYRCLPAPYERACQVAFYFSRAKKKSRVLILDANDDVTSKGALFKQAWAERYRDMIEYRPNFVTADVDAASGTAISEFDDRVQAAVLNVIPPQRAATIAVDAGLANINRRWCEVDFLTFESTLAKGVHVLGDAIQTAELMPKSGHMANQHAKLCAAAVVDLLSGRAPNPNPSLSSTCYSFVSDQEAMHIASVHGYDAAKKTLLAVPGSLRLSTTANALEGEHAMRWMHELWADMLA